MKTVLITGSSGYIGQHLVKLLKSKYDVYGIDKVTLLNDYLKANHFVQVDIDYPLDNWLFNFLDFPEPFDVVVHLAALVRVGESVEMPAQYYLTNLMGTTNVLENISCRNFVFASTGTAANPSCPYARSKRCAEDVVENLCRKAKNPYTMFRFYNVIGTDGQPATNPDGLFYNLVKAKETGEFNLYGNDYNTQDGTAIRDYVHVIEICHAIEEAIEKPSNSLENLGHGQGYSVQEIIDIFKKVNNCDFKINVLPRRAGDLEYSVLDNVSSYMKSLYKIDELLKA